MQVNNVRTVFRSTEFVTIEVTLNGTTYLLDMNTHGRCYNFRYGLSLRSLEDNSIKKKLTKLAKAF